MREEITVSFSLSNSRVCIEDRVGGVSIRAIEARENRRGNQIIRAIITNRGTVHSRLGAALRGDERIHLEGVGRN